MTKRFPASPTFKKSLGLPGFVGWLVVTTWFLLTVMSPVQARENSSSAAIPVEITAADLLPDIEIALGKKGVTENASIYLAEPEKIIARNTDFAIGYTSYNPGSGRFVVRLTNGASVTGEAQITQSAVVLKRPIARGERISADDIIEIDIEVAQAGNIVQSPDDLIDMEARRTLRANTPIQPRDIALPIAIKKGALITLTYAIEGLRLSHQGIAQANGSAGDIISVKNIQSDRVLKAVVMREGLARVAAPIQPWKENS